MPTMLCRQSTQRGVPGSRCSSAAERITAQHTALATACSLISARLNTLDIDVEGQTACAETGLTAREVAWALAPHGLAVGFGDTGSVGIGGLTLGGGIGFLSRLYGLTIDNVTAAEIVTADGRVRIVDHEHEPDLFGQSVVAAATSV
jgi:FAD/FMN-containing dehydrogenase